MVDGGRGEYRSLNAFYQRQRPWRRLGLSRFNPMNGRRFGGWTCLVAFFAAAAVTLYVLSGGLTLPRHQSGPQVSIPQGTFVGVTVPIDIRISVDEFLGIPYATQPVGSGRFQPVDLPPSSDKIFDATYYGANCMQASGNLGSNEREDCLYLNVYRPTHMPFNKTLPVVVFFHGGSFVAGSSKSRNMEAVVAWSSEPIIAVSVNYRLGALGFLAGSVIARAGTLNLGLLDQVKSLEWVQTNIKEFGGDPSRVTLLGDSAGAHAIGHHLLGPMSRDLFHQVIMESGAPTARFCQPPSSTLIEQQSREFYTAMGIDPARLTDDEVMSTLRRSSFMKIKQASRKVWLAYSDSDRWAFQPVIDGPGGVIEMPPIQKWTSGNWNKAAILTGFCTDEGAPFVPTAVHTNAEFTGFFSTLNPQLNQADLAAISRIYPDPVTNPDSPYVQKQPGPGAQHNRLMAAYGQFAYIAPVRQTAHFASKSPNDPPVYLYQCGQNASIIQGTGHSCVGGFVEYSPGIVKISPTQRTLVSAVNAYWTNFIANGDPNVGSRSPKNPVYSMAPWPRYVEGVKTPNKMVLGAGNDERLGGKNVGKLTMNVSETQFVKESNFWWSKTALAEV